MKLYYSKPYTYLEVDGKTFKAKCSESEPFDEEKGALVCLSKANGYSYGDINKMIKEAYRFDFKKMLNSICNAIGDMFTNMGKAFKGQK